MLDEMLIAGELQEPSKKVAMRIRLTYLLRTAAAIESSSLCSR